MGEHMVAILVLLVTALLGGAALGVLCIVAVGIHREGHGSTLNATTRDSVCLGTRKLTGVRVTGISPLDSGDDDDHR